MENSKIPINRVFLMCFLNLMALAHILGILVKDS